MTDKTDLVVELIKGLKEDQKSHREETKEWNNKFDDRMGRLETDMKIHIEGVNQNRTKNEQQDMDILDLNSKHLTNAERLDKIEEPGRVRGFIKNRVLQLGGLAAAILVIIKFVEYFNK